MSYPMSLCSLKTRKNSDNYLINALTLQEVILSNKPVLIKAISYFYSCMVYRTNSLQQGTSLLWDNNDQTVKHQFLQFFKQSS